MSEVLEKKWLFKARADEERVNSFSDELNINPVLTELLLQRGISNLNKARTFFRPSLDFLHNPWEMKDMDRAVDRVLEAILNEERIMVLGDYDVDGTTATALVFRYLFRLSSKVEYCLLYTSPSPRDGLLSRMPSSA